MRRLRLTVPMRDAWLLAATAIDLGNETEAGILADRAAQIGDWNRYRPEGNIWGLEYYSLDLIPRGWMYYGPIEPYRNGLLGHPESMQMVAHTARIAKVFRTHAYQYGLLRMERPLTDAVIMALSIPDFIDG